jgi:hypothetical protein
VTICSICFATRSQQSVSKHQPQTPNADHKNEKQKKKMR